MIPPQQGPTITAAASMPVTSSSGDGDGNSGSDSASGVAFAKRAPSDGAFVRARFAGRGRDGRAFLATSRTNENTDTEQ
jgi:hypothetical protein